MSIIDVYKKKKNLSGVKKVASVLLLLSWVVFIWHNSMEGAGPSGMRSTHIVNVVNGLLWEGMIVTEHVIRKMAHFLEYAVEGILAVFLFRAFEVGVTKNLCGGALLGVMTALIDETIQLFSVGRNGAVEDVWIDFGGFALGFLISVMLCKLRQGDCD